MTIPDTKVKPHTIEVRIHAAHLRRAHAAGRAEERADLLAYFVGNWQAVAYTDWGDAIAELKYNVEQGRHEGASKEKP